MTVTDEPTVPTDAEPDAPPPTETLPDVVHAIADFDALPSWKEMQGLAAMAVTLAGARNVPEGVRGSPNDVFLLLLTARELGIAPTTALRTCYVVNGQVTIAPKLKAAKVRQLGLGRLWPDPGNDTTKATWHATRADEDHSTVYTFTFTIEDARRAKEKRGTLADKDNWQSYPQRMLSWRALGYLLDDVFPEVGTGLYSPDELGAVTDEEGTPVIDVASADPLPGTHAPRGHNAPPSPNDEPAPAEEIARIRARLAALGPEAHAALEEMWTRRREDGSQTLPPIPRLLVRHLGRAKAMIESVESRARKGEWGPWEPRAEPAEGQTSDEGPADAPESPDEPATVRESPEAVPRAPGPAEAPENVPDVAPEPAEQPSVQPDPAVVEAQVKAMSNATVLAELDRRGLETAPRDADRRRALALAIFAEWGGTVPAELAPKPADPPATLMEAMERLTPETAPGSEGPEV